MSPTFPGSIKTVKSKTEILEKFILRKKLIRIMDHVSHFQHCQILLLFQLNANCQNKDCQIKANYYLLVRLQLKFKAR